LTASDRGVLPVDPAEIAVEAVVEVVVEKELEA
jgi:hypothetical protein